LLREPDLGVFVVNGHLPDDRYRRLLARAKITLSYIRHHTVLPTRALEALHAGGVTAVQRGCVLRAFAGEQEGVIEYEGPGDVAAVVRAALTRWPELAAAARRGRDVVEREFARARVSSQYLRFLAVLAARPRGERARHEAAALVQARPILHRGLLPAPAPVLEAASVWHARRARRRGAPEPLELARALVLGYADHVRAGGAPDPARVERILALYRAGLEAAPASLAARVNLVRVAVYFGDATQVASALRVAHETLAAPRGAWRTDPLDDVFPWDFGSEGLDYRSYFDAAVRELGEGTPGAAVRETLLRAALHHYVGRATASLEDLEAAMRLAPGFCHYALAWAARAVHAKDARMRTEAVATLLGLAESSSVAPAAIEALLSPACRGELDAATHERLRRLAVRTGHAIASFNQLTGDPWITMTGRMLVRKRRAEGPSPSLSLVIVDWSQPAVAASVELAGLPREGLEVIWVECFDYVRRDVWDLADTIVTCGQSDPPHAHRGWNAGLSLARAPMVGFMAAGQGARPATSLAALVRDGARATRVDGLALVWRADALTAGGFDEDERFAGPAASLDELVARINAGPNARRPGLSAASPSRGFPPGPRALVSGVLRVLDAVASRALPPRSYHRFRQARAAAARRWRGGPA
jgi:hypothetical protein